MALPLGLISSPFSTPTLTLVLCVLAAAGTFLALPKPERSASLRTAGLGMFTLTMIAGAVIVGLWGLSNAVGGASYVYFWIFAAMAVLSAIRVITHPLPVYSALYFVVTVFASAGMFVLMWAEFLAAALIVIYAGAILVTYTFVIMLAGEASGQGLVSRIAGGTAELAEHDARSRDPFIASVAGFTVMGVLMHVIFAKAEPIQAVNTGGAGTIGELAAVLFGRQFVTLQVAGIILTLAMVGAVVIARKRVLLSEEESIKPGDDDRFDPGDDNPHAVEVAGEPGPRTRRVDREMAEL